MGCTTSTFSKVACSMALETCMPCVAPRDIPYAYDQLDSKWLTTTLRTVGVIDAGTVATVVNAERIAVGEGLMSVLVRLTIAYSGGSQGPDTLIAKITPTQLKPRVIGAMLGLFQTEVNFYRNRLDDFLPAPRCYFADIREDGRFVLLMEDMAPLKVCDQLNEVGPSKEQVFTAVRTLATLHSAQCGKTRTDEKLAFLRRLDNRAYWAGTVKDAFMKHAPNFKQNAAQKGLTAEVTPTMLRCIKLIEENYDGLMDMYFEAHRLPETAGILTVVHGDFRPENLFFHEQDGKSVITAVDFQTMAEGIGERDVAYFASMLPTATRRKWEQEMIKAYYEARGGDAAGYSMAQCLLNYQFSMLVPVMVAAMAMPELEDSERGRKLMSVVLRRTSAHLDDWQFAEAFPVHVQAAQQWLQGSPQAGTLMTRCSVGDAEAQRILPAWCTQLLEQGDGEGLQDAVQTTPEAVQMTAAEAKQASRSLIALTSLEHLGGDLAQSHSPAVSA